MIEVRKGRWVVLSEEGKELGSYATEAEAKARLRQIERFKSKDARYVRRIDRLDPIVFVPEGTKSDSREGFTARMTSEGFLKIEGRISGIGVYEYCDAVGNTWGEFRSAEEVFDPESLASFEMKPVTDDHPAEMVNAHNVGELQKGHLGSNIRPNEQRTHVVADMLITDSDLIAKIRSGKTQLSNGYEAIVIQQDGVTENGTPYSAIQSKIRGNHNAVVDMARGGPSCCFILDGAAINSKGFDQMKVIKKDGKIVIDGTEFEVPDAVASAFDAMREKLAAKDQEEEEKEKENQVEIMVEEEEKEKEEEEQPTITDTLNAANADSVTALRAQVDTLTAKLQETTSTQNARIDARVALVTKVREVLGSDAKTDGVSDIDLMRAVVAHVTPGMKAKCDKGSVDYVKAAYEMAITHHDSRVDSTEELMALTHEAQKGDVEVDLDALYTKHLDSLRNRSLQEVH